jgi:hypothetical protein
VLLVEGERRRPEGVSDRPEDRLGRAGHRGAHPLGQQDAPSAVGRAVVDPLGGVGQHQAAVLHLAVDLAEVQQADLVRLAGAGARPERARERHRTAIPARRDPHATPGEAGTGEVPTGFADRVGRGAGELHRPARDVGQPSCDPPLLVGRDTGRAQVDREQPAATVGNVRRDQGPVEQVRGRAPRLRAVEHPAGAVPPGFQAHAGAFGGIDPPGRTLGRWLSGLGQDGQGVQVRLGDPGGRQVPGRELGQDGPTSCGLAGSGHRHHRADRASQVNRGPGPAVGPGRPLAQVVETAQHLRPPLLTMTTEQSLREAGSFREARALPGRRPRTSRPAGTRPAPGAQRARRP